MMHPLPSVALHSGARRRSLWSLGVPKRTATLVKVVVATLVALSAFFAMTSAFAQPAPQRDPSTNPGNPEQRLNRRVRDGHAPGVRPNPAPQPDPITADGHSAPATEGAHGAAATGHEGTAEGHEAGHEGGHEGGHAEHEHKRPDFNFAEFSNKEVTPYAALLINFGLLIGLYYVMGKKGVADGLKKRKEAIAKEIEEAQRMLKEAEERAKTYQAKLKNVEAELTNAKKALEEAGKGERDRIVREAEEKAERMKRDAAFLVDQELKQMRVDLTREAIELAMQTAEEMLKTKATAEDHTRLADDFLRDLEKAGPAPRVGTTGGAA